MNKHFDIAIVGAGPAGSIFAREIVSRCPAMSVLLIDAQSEENKKCCGGLLAPDAQKVLAQFDLTLPKSILSDPQIFAVETIDLDSRCVRYYQRHYLNMDRYGFDKWLLSLIPDSITVYSASCNSIHEENGAYTLNVTHASGEGESVFASAVVGADGGGSVVRRQLIGGMPKQYVSIQEWYEHKGQKLPYYSCIFDKETSDSCSWTIHKDGYVIFGGAFEKQGCKEAFERQKARLEKFIKTSFGEPVKKEACLVTSPRKMSDFCCGKGSVYLLGEAAGFISSSSFEGISGAMLSAKLLAEAFEKGKDHRAVLRIYRKKTHSLRLKLFTKTFKRFVLCSPPLRRIIMKSGIQSIKK